MSKYAIFLDIDGVLCGTRMQLGHTCASHPMWDRFDPIAVDFLNRLDADYHIDFVLCTTWKNYIKHDDPMYYHWINSSFRNAGFRGNFPYPNWKTNPKNEMSKYNNRNGRAYEVKDYLDDFGPYDDFLIFDDSNYEYNQVLGKKRWIRCNAEDGILTKQMKHTLSLVGQWEKKK